MAPTVTQWKYIKIQLQFKTYYYQIWLVFKAWKIKEKFQKPGDEGADAGETTDGSRTAPNNLFITPSKCC